MAYDPKDKSTWQGASVPEWQSTMQALTGPGIGNGFSQPTPPATANPAPWSNPPQGVPNPYSSGPGLQPGQNQPQFQGGDLTQYGPGEQYYFNNSQSWQNPSFGEMNNRALVGQYSDPNARPQVSQNAQQWLQQYQSNMPGIPTEPGFGAYFDNAKNRAAESINAQAAARGNYGSSAAMDQNARAFTDLEGQRALKEADYNLARLGEQRAWQGLGGNLAGQADQLALQRSQDEQNWANTLARFGMDASQLGLQRLNAGQDASTNAQNLGQNRVQGAFNNKMAVGDRMAGLMERAYYPALDNDAALMQLGLSGNVAMGNNAAAQEQQNLQNSLDLFNQGLGTYDYLTNRGMPAGRGSR